MKTIVRLLVALAALGPASCARREAPPTFSATLSRHLAGDPATLDPTITTEENGACVEALLFRPLVGIDADRRSVPGLATSWSVSPDGLTYEFHLDPEASWEDGSPVTSDDVRFTIERVRDPKVAAMTWSRASRTSRPSRRRSRAASRALPQALRGAPARLQRPDRLAAAFGRGETDRKPVGDGRTASSRGRRTRRSARAPRRMRRARTPRFARSCSA